MNFDPNTGQPIYNGYQQPVQQKKTNGFAIAGLLCSIFVGSITGIIFSAIGLGKVKETNDGKGMAIAGLIISIIRLVLLFLLIFIFPFLIWPATKNSITQSAHCAEAYSCQDLGNGTARCKYIDGYNEIQYVTCPIGNNSSF